MQTRKSASLPLPLELFVFLLGWLVILPLIAICAPFATLASWWTERRLRQFYLNANRLLHWDRARQLSSSGNGMLVIEVHLLERAGHFWWIGHDGQGGQSDPPLAPVSVLDPSFDIERRFELLHDDATKVWWDSHLQEMSERVFYVKRPLAMSRQWDEIRLLSNVVIVDDAWTYAFRNPPRSCG
jgi:hypothetical protein